MSTRRRIHRDTERDIQAHIEMETRENIERGMSPAEARLAALRKFGNPLRVAEETRAVWSWMWADSLLQDARYALRGLRRNPSFAAVALCTLALGIGMNTAVFSVVSAVLIKPLPYPAPDRLVWLANYYQPLKLQACAAFDFADWRSQAHSFEELAAYGTADRTVQQGSESAKHPFVFFTPNFWQMAGARAAFGRLFTAADHDVVVLSWRIFEQRFAADPGVVGRVVEVDGRPSNIVGVLPKDFRFLPPPGVAGLINGEPEVFSPIVLTPEMQVRGRNLTILFVVGRLKAGVSEESARAELQAIQDRVARNNSAMRDFYLGLEVRVTSLQDKLVGASRRALWILLAAVGFVLLVACANLGNLLLARASARQREIAIRAAIGAGRDRLLRQFLVEGFVLAVCGGALGIAMARVADSLLIRLNPAAIPRLTEVAIDWRVGLFALTISLFSGVMFGLAPVLGVSANSLYRSLKDGGPSTGSRGPRLRRVLVAAELAMAMVLLTGAGLMIKSFARMYTYPAGFVPEQTGLLKVFLSGPAYRQRQAVAGYAQRVIERLSQVPGVQGLAVMSSSAGPVPVELEAPQVFVAGQAPQVRLRTASAGYPSVVGIPLVKGRWITDDEPNPVAMVNQTFVRRMLGDVDPLGRRVRANGTVATIVGVTGDLKIARLDADPDPELLIPYRQMAYFGRFDILVRIAGATGAVLPELRSAVLALDPSQPPYGVTTLEQALRETVAPRRFNLILLATFASTAVLLALAGIYGVIAYAVTQRTHEIGVRMALGARSDVVVRMVAGQGIGVALTGIGVGIAAALALTRTMSTLLFEVKPDDPVTFAVVAAVLTIGALAASWIPARKAAHVDPLEALRYE